jgi:hypothetical protein
MAQQVTVGTTPATPALPSRDQPTQVPVVLWRNCVVHGCHAYYRIEVNAQWEWSFSEVPR